MDEQAGLARNLGLSEAGFLAQVFDRIDTSGTQVAGWLEQLQKEEA
jgi:hypothetical protein